MKKTIAILLFLFFQILLFSQKEFKTHSISIFKDGTVFLDKSTTLNAKTGQVILEDLPFNINSEFPTKQIIFGSIWMSAPNNSIPFSKISLKKEKTEIEMTSLNSILGKNLKKQIKVYQKHGLEVQGVLQMLDNNNSLVIKSGNQWLRIPKDEMVSFEFLEEMTTTVTVPSSQKILELNFSKKAKKQPFHLMYLQKGMAWAPNYFLQILGNQKARLTLKANVMNDLEDLENVEMNFVVGVPAFKYERVHDPFVSNSDFQSFLNSLNQRSYEPVLTFDPETYEEQVQLVPAATKTKGVKNEDLFFYRKQNVTLKKGGRAMFDILETEFDYKDVYTVQIEQNSTSRNYHNNDQEHQKNTVWHTLNFKNKTDFPFTAGSVFFLKKGKGARNMPIGQNQILYTPSTGDAEVRMAVASDILVLDADEELKRQTNLITVKGTIDVTNFQNQAVQLKIEREIKGSVLECDFPWETTGLTTQLNSLNQKFHTQWAFELNAKESKKITYTYEVYVK